MSNASGGAVAPERQQRQAIQSVLDQLPPDAPVRAIVYSVVVQNMLSAYEAADRTASRSQRSYNRWGRLGITATTAGVIVGALFLVPLEGHLDDRLATAAHAGQQAALAITLFAAMTNFLSNSRRQWMDNRSQAESLRGAIFNLITTSPGPANVRPALLASEKLRLVDAAYIEAQLNVFKASSAKHARRIYRWLPLRILAYGLVVVAFMIGINLPGILRIVSIPVPEGLAPLMALLELPQASRWQLGMTTVASAFLAHATARTLTDEDARKAELYKVTERKLAKLLMRSRDQVAKAVATGDQHLLSGYFAEAHGIIAQEHAVWSFMRPDLNDDDQQA